MVSANDIARTTSRATPPTPSPRATDPRASSRHSCCRPTCRGTRSRRQPRGRSASRPVARHVDDDDLALSVKVLTHATNGARPRWFAHERAPRARASRRAVTSSRLLTETFPTIIDRGASVADAERLIYVPEFAIDQLKDCEALILLGAREPVSFFAYPNLRVASRPTPPRSSTSSRLARTRTRRSWRWPTRCTHPPLELERGERTARAPTASSRPSRSRRQSGRHCPKASSWPTSPTPAAYISSAPRASRPSISG